MRPRFFFVLKNVVEKISPIVFFNNKQHQQQEQQQKEDHQQHLWWIWREFGNSSNTIKYWPSIVHHSLDIWLDILKMLERCVILLLDERKKRGMKVVDPDYTIYKWKNVSWLSILWYSHSLVIICLIIKHYYWRFTVEDSVRRFH